MIKRADGRWQDQVKLPGMQKPKYFYGKTQKEVKQKMAAWQKEQVAGEKFETVADEWAVEHAKKVSYNASEAYNAPMKEAKEQFGGRSIESITPDEIDAYIKWIAGRGYARRTVQQRYDMLNMIFRYAIVKHGLSSNPCAAVDIPTGLPKNKRRIPSDAELELVRAGRVYDFGLFAYMLLYTGVRRGELLALRWEDIDRKNKVINIDKSVYFAGNSPMIKPPKTEAGTRKVVLLDDLDRVLPSGGKGYIFGGEKPLTKTVVRKRWIKWCREAGLAEAKVEKKKGKDGRMHDSVKWDPDITPHQLRHAFATFLFDAGIDEKDAQEILGHSSIQVTRDIYTHIRQARKESTAKRLNEFLANSEKREPCQNIVIFPGSLEKQG